MDRNPKKMIVLYMDVSHNLGYPFERPYNKDENILGYILGSPYFGKLLSLLPIFTPCQDCVKHMGLIKGLPEIGRLFWGWLLILPISYTPLRR